MKKFTHLVLALSFLFSFSTYLKASHGLPLINPSYTIGATGVTISASSDGATCGNGPFWMQTKVSCSPSDFPNAVQPAPCLKTFLTNWAGPGVNYNAFPWYHSLLDVPNYTSSAGWSDGCVLEPYHTTFIPFSDLCPGKVYYFASREVLGTGTGASGLFTAVNSFTVPGTPVPETPGFITSNPTTSPSNPSCGGPVLLTLTPPTGCGVAEVITPGCTGSTCNQIVWRGPGGVVIAVNTLTVLVNPSATSTYSVGYDTCSIAYKTGCGLSVTPITVHVANTNAAFAPPPTVCAGSNVNFTAVLPALNETWSVSPTTSVTPSSGTGPNFSAIFDLAGTYTITHQSINGSCTDTKTQIITITPGITSSMLTSGGGCAGSSGVGTATVSVSTSTVGLTYSWAPTGGTSNVETNIPFNTTYTVTMSNGGCVITKTVQISNNPPPTITSFSVTSPLCNGQLNGIVAANLTSGNPPFTFTWTPTITQTTQTVTGVGAGTYSVFVIDNNGCTTNSVVTVTEPSAITLTTSTSATICSGNSTTLTATAGGGTPSYTYTWNPGNLNGSSPVIVTPASSTQYTGTVTDANGCSLTQTVNITVGLPLTASANSQSICASSGSVILTPTITSAGNGAPYNYLWSNGAITPTISVPANSTPSSDTYSVTISDGCTTPSAAIIFTVVTTTAPTVSSFNVNQPLCNGQLTGTVSVNLNGGSAPFSFTWSPTITQTTQTVTGVGAGTYSVQILDNAGCSTSSVVTVSQPSPINLSVSSNTSICYGKTATLTSTVSGGSPVYSYTWTPGNTGGSSATVSPTTTTQYTCFVTDANGCSINQSVNVTVSAPLTVAASAHTICIGGAVVLTPSITSAGNGGPYSYIWSNSATTSTIEVNSGSSAGTSNYGVTVSDGCTLPNAFVSFTVVTNPTPVANIVADSLIGNAPLTVNFADLGNGGNTFSWNFANGSTSTLQNPPSQTYQTGGTYLVLFTSTSTSGCVANDTLSITVIDLIPEIIIPNVFTPNGDKANDLFAVKAINVTSFECSVFNRWGKLVFSSSDITNSWDGKINGNNADEGTYFYIIKAAGSVGDDIKKQGYVTLFR